MVCYNVVTVRFVRVTVAPGTARAELRRMRGLMYEGDAGFRLPPGQRQYVGLGYRITEAILREPLTMVLKRRAG